MLDWVWAPSQTTQHRLGKINSETPGHTKDRPLLGSDLQCSPCAHLTETSGRERGQAKQEVNQRQPGRIRAVGTPQGPSLGRGDTSHRSTPTQVPIAILQRQRRDGKLRPSDLSGVATRRGVIETSVSDEYSGMGRRCFAFLCT